jgi:hypothetical protein
MKLDFGKRYIDIATFLFMFMRSLMAMVLKQAKASYGPAGDWHCESVSNIPKDTASQPVPSEG